MSRGGYQCLGKRQANNTSGVPGLQFREEVKRGRSTPQRIIVVSIGDWNTKRGTTLRGVAPAMREALELRARHGYPVPALSTALRKWGEFWSDPGRTNRGTR